MAHEPTEDLNTWLRVHTLSLTNIKGTLQHELLLELGVAPVLTTDTPQGRQVRAQPERLVLGPDAASILLRLLIDAGVAPKDGEIGVPHGH